MWKRIAPLLVLFSLALNVAFVGVWIVGSVLADGASRPATAGDTGCPLRDHLDLTEGQCREMRLRVDDFRWRSQPICADVNRLRRELIDLIAAESPDLDAIAATQNDIGAGQARMRALVVEHLVAAKALLGPDQQHGFFELIRQRSACDGPGRMVGLGSGAPASPTHEAEQGE